MSAAVHDDWDRPREPQPTTWRARARVAAFEERERVRLEGDRYRRMGPRIVAVVLYGDDRDATVAARAELIPSGEMLDATLEHALDWCQTRRYRDERSGSLWARLDRESKRRAALAPLAAWREGSTAPAVVDVHLPGQAEPTDLLELLAMGGAR